MDVTCRQPLGRNDFSASAIGQVRAMATLAGRRVRAIGLVNREELNGRCGLAVRYVASKDRYVVSGLLDGGSILVRPCNLAAVDEPSVRAAQNGVDYLAQCDVSGAQLEFGDWYHRLDGTPDLLAAPIAHGVLASTDSGGGGSYDICGDVYRGLAREEQARYVRIDTMEHVHAHIGPPPEEEQLPDETPSLGEACGADAAAGARAKAAAVPAADAGGGSSARPESLAVGAATEALRTLLDVDGRDRVSVRDVRDMCRRLNVSGRDDAEAAKRGQDATCQDATWHDGEPSVGEVRDAMVAIAKSRGGVQLTRAGPEAPEECTLRRLPVG